MRWDDNLTLEGTEDELAVRGQLQLSMYAVHLAGGNSIHCKSIKSSTIEQYLLAASTLLSSFTGLDYRKDNPTDRQFGAVLTSVLKDIRRFEAMPDRREPYDHNMHDLARQLATKFPTTSLVCALVDGFEQGMCTGYRLSE